LVFIFKMTIPYISNPYTDISFISFLEFGWYSASLLLW
jgi:hypothetical protein